MAMKKIAISAMAAVLISPAAALAGSYEAYCSGAKCTVNISSAGISSAQGSISPSRISYWSINGQSSTNVGVGVATTIIFGPLGLLGFLAKKHNYNFTVDGYDQDGRRVALQFRFKKEEPAKNITEELFKISGLPMGRQRSIAEIKAIESGESPLNAMSGEIEPALANVQKSRDCGRVLRDFDCNYSAYLDANPSIKQWADLNPELAAKERARLGAYTDDELEKRQKAKARKKANSLGKMDSTLGGMNQNDKPSCNFKLQKYECSFNAYLDANPAMKQWAEQNPKMAENERIKLQSID